LKENLEAQEIARTKEFEEACLSDSDDEGY